MWQYRPGLKDLKSYSVEEGDWAVKLDANESALPLPPAVHSRLVERLATLPFNRYPEISQHSLRQKIAASLGLTEENVAVGNGSSELLQVLCYILGGSGRKIVFPNPSFSMYPTYCLLSDSQPAVVDLDADFSLSPARVIEAARREKASLVILCNPNNPTGNVMPPEAVEEVLAGCRCPVVVDEAYGEFYEHSALGLLGKYPNLIVARTFSKAYGLASARVGYTLAGKDLTAALRKALMPFHVSMLSLAAAETVYDARAEFSAGIAQTLAERQRLADGLGRVAGLTVYPSAANFLLVKSAREGELTASLARGGICIRGFGNAPGLENCLRITVGSPM